MMYISLRRIASYGWEEYRFRAKKGCWGIPMLTC